MSIKIKKKGEDFIPLGCMGNKSTELKLLLPIILYCTLLDYIRLYAVTLYHLSLHYSIV